MIEICNILQLNTILFWFASDKINFSVFQCNELINYCRLDALIIAVQEDKFNRITILIPIFEKTLKTRRKKPFHFMHILRKFYENYV